MIAETHVTAADALVAVQAAARAARGTVADLASVPGERLDDALREIADQLGRAYRPGPRGQRGGHARGAGRWPRRRPARPAAPGRGAARGHRRPLFALADVPAEPSRRTVSDLPDGLLLEERRRPVGVVGANFEARPNVTVDVASQLLKSRNAGVLRTGAAGLRSAIALFDHVIGPAVAAAGLDPGAFQLVRTPGQAAQELVSQPGLIPLVILRGSGETTRLLAAEAARHGVRTLAHADGGGVLYLDRAADPGMAGQIITASLDRLGVCNRLNLLLSAPTPGMSCCRSPRPARPGRDRLAAAARPPARPGVGAEPGPGGHRHGGPGRRPGAGSRDRQRQHVRAGRRDRHRRPPRGVGVPGRLPRHRRVLERQHPAAGRLQAARLPETGINVDTCPVPAAGHLPGPVPAAVRGPPALYRAAPGHALGELA